jgi:hypothetical protein
MSDACFLGRNRSTCRARHITCNHIRVIFETHFCCLLPLPTRLWCPGHPPRPHTISLYLLLYYVLMPTIPPPFNWSKRLEYNWCSVDVKGIEKLRRLVGPFLSYTPNKFQLGCTARIMNGQVVLSLSTTGDGKSALIYLPSIARKGTITLVICPTNFFESDLVCLTNIY